MRFFKYFWFLLFMILSLNGRAQFNPTNPPEPGVTYKLTLSGLPANGGSTSGGGSYAPGTRTTAYASPQSGYIFENWTDNEGNIVSTSSSYTFYMPEKNLGLTAHFRFSPSSPSEPSSSPQYANVSVTSNFPENVRISGTGRYAVGESVVISATPSSGFKIENWSINGQIISYATSCYYVVKEGENDISLKMSYSPDSPAEPISPASKYKLGLKMNPPAAGSFNVASGNSYEAGTNIYLNASLISGYKVTSWTDREGNILSYSSAFYYSMPNSNTELTCNAVFSPSSPSEPESIQPRRNIIYGSRRSAGPASNVLYGVSLENVDRIEGISVDIAFPEGYIPDYSGIVLTERTLAHTVNIQQVDDSTVRVILHGQSDISGGNGEIFRIPVYIPADATPGESLNVSISKGVTFFIDGSQSPTATSDGILKIAEEEITLPDSPDFVVKDITVSRGEVMPGDIINIGWTVRNEGNLEGLSGWSETISMIGAKGNVSHLATLYYDTDRIAPEESVARNATLTIPALPGIDGAFDIRITLSPYSSSGEIEERRANNTTMTDTHSFRLGKTLQLEIPESVVEGSETSIRALLSRSGDWTAKQDFSLSADDSRIRIPDIVSIPKGQSGVYFIISLIDNDDLDENTSVTISVSGSDYEPLSRRLEITDDEFPAIALTFEDDVITEGETTSLTLTLPRATESNLSIALSCDVSDRFEFPSSFVIPAGNLSASITVKAVDNSRIENSADALFRASALHYEPGEAWLEVLDNDMPRLNLQIAPDEVSEGAGPRAIRATLSRSENTDKAVTVLLSDDTPGNLIYSNKITLEKGVTETDFNIGIVDNSRMEGDRTVTLTAAVYIQNCSCSATMQSGGAVDRSIHIIDNDGPSLAISVKGATLIKENPATQLQISRNTNADNALEITLSAEPTGLLNLPEKVVIPAGKEYISLDIEAFSSAFDGSEKQVILNASTPGFSKGTSLLLISDRKLPDAVVEIQSSDMSAAPGSTIQLNVRIRNVGNDIMPDAAPIDIYLDNSSVLTLYSSGVLAPGEEEELTCSIKAPSIPGSYSATAHINDGMGFSELTRTNNVSEPLHLTVTSPFTPEISADASDLLPGETLTFEGNVAGYRDSIEVYYIMDGVRFSTNTTPNEYGDFSVSIIPEYAGNYIFGVCVPGENKSEKMGSFAVRGVQADNGSSLLFDINVGESVTRRLRLTNRSAIPVNNIEVLSVGLPEDCTLTIKAPENLEPDSSDFIEVSITGKRVSDGTDWLSFPIEIKADGIPSISRNCYLYCRANTAKLIASVNAINTTMTMGSSKVYRLSIANNGKGATGDISLSLPAFMQKGTSTVLPSLEFGETADVDIIMTPSADMQLNVPVSGRIGINCTNGDGIALAYSVEPVSDQTGVLIVDVKDEYTFATSEALHVENADVIISHPVSGKLIARGSTNADGLFSYTLPEGFYSIEVSATNHGVYNNMVQVDAGKDNFHPVFIPFEAISYSWEVVETTVDDTYDIVTKVDFETRVPKPVVVVEFPKLSWKNQIAYISITNKGLISATNIDVNLPESIPGISLEVIGDSHLPVLLAGENRMIPIRVKVEEEDLFGDLSLTVSGYSYTGSYVGESDSSKASAIRKAVANSGCVSIPCKITVDDPECDPLTGEPIYGKTKQIDGTYRAGNCGHPGTWPPSTSIIDGQYGFGSLWSGPSIPGLGGGGVKNEKVSTYWQDRLYTFLTTGCASDCEKKLANAIKTCADALAECKGWKFDAGLLSCGAGLLDNCLPSKINSVHDAVSCGSAAAGCFPGKGCPAGVIDCFNRAYEAFQECLKAYRANKNKGNKSRSLASHSEIDEDDDVLTAKEKRAESVWLYFNILKLVSSQTSNLLGEGNWERMSGEEFSRMLSSLDSKSDADGYFPIGEEALAVKPEGIDLSTFLSFIERYNNSLKYEKTGEISENMMDRELMKSNASEMKSIEDRIYELDYPDLHNFATSAIEEYNYLIDSGSQPVEGVCASISLKFNQTMVLTRQAFRGTLSITNGNEEVDMTDIRLNVRVRDAEGNQVGEREFAVQAESLTGFDGDLSLNSGWRLPAGNSGEATILFIPSKYAAPLTPLTYSFGGVLSYTDPFTGMEVSRELAAIDMVVSPSPQLDMHYFMQRDVLGDDPLTSERIEPSEEAEFALLIHNKGFGDANSLRMTTHQPEIVDNTKGLAINFEIVGSSLNGLRSTMAIGEKIPTNFGDVKALSTTYAQWWLKSSLMGHFTSYDVSAMQVSAYGSEDMSLLDNVEIHELIHGFTPEGKDSSRAFLVNDIPDAETTPDMVWMSEAGDAFTVAPASRMDIDYNTENNECLISVNAETPGWIYGNILTPWDGIRKITSVRRMSDGRELPPDNFWLTYVTLLNSTAPKYENRMHCAVELSGGSEKYLVTLEPQPEPELDILSFSGIPEEGVINPQPLKKVGIIFNKDINPDSFTNEDVVLSCQGKKVNTSAMRIHSSANDEDFRLFEIDFGNSTTENGYYTLTIDLSGIDDSEGYHGSQARHASWIQYGDGKVIVQAFPYPDNAGNINPDFCTVDYAKPVTLKATPATGYNFVKWAQGNITLSETPELTINPTEDTELIAVFSLQNHHVEIEYDDAQGDVAGAGSGLFPHNSELSLIAVPNAHYSFSHWENEYGVKLSESPELKWTVTAPSVLRPIFEMLPTGVANIVTNGVSGIYPIPARDRFFISGNFRELHSVSIIAIDGVRCLTFKGYNTDAPIDISSLTPGNYIVRISTESGVSTHRLIKL